MTVWLDVEDLFRAEPPSAGLYHALHEASAEVRFVRHAAPNALVSLEWPEIATQLAMQAPSRGIPPREAALKLPDPKGNPLAAAKAAQLQALGEFGRFGTNLLRHQTAAIGRAGHQWSARARNLPPLRRAPPAGAFDADSRPGDTLLALGAPWLSPGFETFARMLRDNRRMRVGVLLQDLLPIRRPEWAPPGLSRRFEDWCRDVLPCCDLVLAASQHTAADIEAYARESGFRLPGQVQALPIAAPQPEAPDLPTDRPPGQYVLLAAAMEPRRNHALAVRIWSMLLDEVRAGRRAASSVPDLVFAGQIGWGCTDLLHMLDNTAWLGGRVGVIHAPTRTDLHALYQGCLFTLCPSLAEGSGLPITESLARGKPCLASNAGASQEAGGALCRYFDPENLPEAYRAVAALLDDRSALAAWETQIRRDYRPTPWSETAQALLTATNP